MRTTESARVVHCDALIVGAGIAGCVVAGHLARLPNARIIVIDRATFPRAKVCGGCLQPRAIAALRRAGFGRALDRLEIRRITKVDFSFGGPHRLSIPLAGGRTLGAISRSALDAALVADLCTRGIDVMEGVTARETGTYKGKRWIDARLADGSDIRIEAPMVFACDGLASRLARAESMVDPRQTNGLIGIGAIIPGGAVPTQDLAHGELRMGIHRCGYIGLVRVEDGQIDLAAAVRPSALKELGRLKLLRLLIGQAGVAQESRQARKLDAMSSTSPPLGTRVRRFTAERMALVGDAAGYREPITGEGMAWAAQSAEEAAQAFAHGWSPQAARAYDSARRSARIANSWRVKAAGCLARRPAVGRTIALACAYLPGNPAQLLGGFVPVPPGAARS